MELTTERPGRRFLTPKGVVAFAREQGLDNVKLSTLKRAAYYGDKPLKRTKIGGRVYYALTDVEKWIESCRLADPETTESVSEGTTIEIREGWRL